MSKPYESDADLFKLMRERLFTAVIGDVMDQMGLRRQFLPAGIAPLQRTSKMAGRAMPVLEADIFDDGTELSRGPLARKPFGLMLEALDDLKAGEVYVATGASLRYALWGELMTARALVLKAAGAILDGYVRDADGIEALGFPTFCRGVYAQDQGVRGKVMDFRSAVEIGGIRVEPGTLIYGDREGVLVIPRDAEEEVIVRALEKTETEDAVGEAIRGGMSATQALETFGVM
ncbi:RraA family protein [Sedimentitalea nanhaiensis]|uniref:Putative 4-hydroxy-4-methyl-2-oxoglutarate aldolase n=1 Tax=Sedimentitalea nanhaiensis TaxID=999627 RepID=A0A1I7BG02_9RHOB|nr:RraA family protein [Sedimentitalea nanhaiensis]SFT86052.1 Regulator of RNase E activity RraA [Sedimentitalea nanhaiensis]